VNGEFCSGGGTILKQPTCSKGSRSNFQIEHKACIEPYCTWTGNFYPSICST